MVQNNENSYEKKNPSEGVTTSNDSCIFTTLVDFVKSKLNKKEQIKDLHDLVPKSKETTEITVQWGSLDHTFGIAANHPLGVHKVDARIEKLYNVIMHSDHEYTEWLHDFLAHYPHTWQKINEVDLSLDFLAGEALSLEYGTSELLSLFLHNKNQKSAFFLVVTSILLIVCMLVAVAYYTLAERKVMAFMQRRRGPNVVGFWGLLQPLADGMKLLFKEIIVPRKANLYLFLFAPVITFILALVSWSVVPFQENFVVADVPFGIIFLLAISSLGVYGIIIAGWASNSNYAFLGALRSTAQMISYEITISFVVLTVIFFVGSYNLTDIVYAQEFCWFVFPLLPITLIFFVCMLAETNRAPFDLPEAEAELVAGYNIDYSSITFALFFLGEYANMLLMSSLMVILFFGGWLPFVFFGWLNSGLVFALKLVFFAFSFVWVRATLPRYRYDQLMSLGWKIFLPFTFGFFLFIFGLFFLFEGFAENSHLMPWGGVHEVPFLSELSNELHYTDPHKSYDYPMYQK